MVARSSRLGHSGSRLPGHRYESSRHGLAASRPRTPGSGASAVTSPPTKPSSRFGTRHIVRCNAVVRSAPLPVRHPGPRVTAAGRCTPAPSGPATTASQSGQRHASYHPPRPIMSAARDRMLSIPCRARLRAARHYRTRHPATCRGRRLRPLPGAAAVVTGRCASDRARTPAAPARASPAPAAALIPDRRRARPDCPPDRAIASSTRLLRAAPAGRDAARPIPPQPARADRRAGGLTGCGARGGRRLLVRGRGPRPNAPRRREWSLAGSGAAGGCPGEGASPPFPTTGMRTPS